MTKEQPLLTLKPTPKASKRTKARIREHGQFIILTPTTVVGGVSCTLFGSPDGWFGWIANCEFEIEVKNESVTTSD